VDETIQYPNLTGNQLNTLVLAATPNLWDGSFVLNSLSIDGQPVSNYSINGQRIDIPLASLLPPNGVVELRLNFTLNLPFAEQEDPNISRPRIYGYTSRQINLVNWYPFIVPHISGEWILHDPWYYGEHLVYDSADYEVNLKFTDPASVPIVASSGVPEAMPDGSIRYTIGSARTFAIAASRDFQTSATQVGDVTLTSYYFAFNEAGGQGALQASAQAIQLYSARYGPYPHKSLAIVMGDFNDGMEYSAFYFISRDYFNLYDNTPKNYLVIISAHETAHQWWFDAVANNQGIEPWLDETLATYSERIYYETVHPDLVEWWWKYRYFEYRGPGYVDTPIYEGGGQRPYWDKTYLTGALFMEDLRQRVGDETFFSFLRDYYTRHVGKRATAEDFFRVFRENTAADISDLMAKYFQKTY
jgi:hypothetical protein